MIGKPITGKSFGGCVRYLVNRPEAYILEAEGVRIQSARSITQDFDMQRKMNPGLGKAVGHTILSWSVEDSAGLTDASMAAVAREYMEMMGIRDTQYLIVRHTDRAHPHLHIVYNRVDNHGRTITDRNDYRRNVQACKDLTLKHGYHIAAGKEAVNRQRLKGADKLKYTIHDAIRQALKTCKNWLELEHELRQKGITIHYKYKGNSDEIQGISFEKDGVKFKGSAIDRSMAFAGIDKALSRSSALQIPRTAPTQKGPLRRLPDTSEPGGESVTSHPNTGKDVLETLLDSRPDSAHYDPFGQALKRKKKKRKRKL